MITGIAHNAMWVVDMEKALDFWCGKVGLTKAFTLERDGDKPWIVYLKIANGAFLELFYHGKKDRERAYEFTKIGYNHWDISIPDIVPLAERLMKHGYFKDEAAKDAAIAKKNIWINDQDGNAIEFTEKPGNLEGSSTTEDGVTFTGIGHMAFVVGDMEKSMEFYSNILGFELFDTLDRNGAKWINYLRVSPKSHIELFYGGTEKYVRAPLSSGFFHMCLECEDVYKTVEYLRSKGVEIDTDTSKGADNNFQAWIHDPDGNKIELMTIGEGSPQTKS